jgi:Glycosyl hydrolase catalytic core/Ricin-type beta-trefoil lectin domain-like
MPSLATISFRHCGILLALLAAPLMVSAQTLAHRYSFFSEPDGSTIATDVVASANGTLQGGAVISGGQLVLNGASGTYLNLPSEIINSSFSAVTIETWASFGALPVNCFFWGFGNTDSSGSGEDYIFCAPKAGRVAITGADPGYTGEQNANSGMDWSGQSNLHIVAIYNPPAKQLVLYTNGALAAINTNVTTSISSVNDVYSYIGRSLYSVDPYAPLNVAEFRVWNGALNAQQVALDAASGPAQIITNPGALLSVRVTANSQMRAGATQQAAVAGNFANVTNVNVITYGQATLTSDNTNIVAVSPSGLVTAFAPGTADLIGTYDGLSATQSVTVAGFVTNQFTFDSFGDGFWAILNQGNSRPLTASFSGASQEAYTNGATEQQFEVLYNLPNGTFRLRQHSSWYCLGASNNTPMPGGGATLTFFFNNNPAQQWYLVSAGNGFYRIFNAASNLVLQTDNETPAHVTLVPASGSPCQLWQFVYQTHYPKKGCAGYEGDYAQFGLNWAYNYDDNTGVSLPAYVDFVPMVWGQYWEPVSNLQARDPGWLAQSPPAYLLTFNEPDNSSQANMSVSTAISMWPSLEELDVPLVGPAMQNTEDSWENSFYQAVATNHYRVDYVAVHEYVPPNASSLISDLQSVYNAYGRPVWLTEFSPVDWSGNQGWTEDDDYNFLAEFLWMAESQDWLKRYAIFPFSGSNPNPPYVSVTVGYRGNFFESDGVTLTPYGELYAAWDGNTNLQPRTPYFIHNLATSFRLTSTNTSAMPVAQDIYWRDASAQWALLPAPTTNHWYIISLNDGRRLQDDLGAVSLAPVGTVGPLVEWTFTGPDSKGYYFVGNPLLSENLNASGTPPAIAFSMVSSATQNNNTRWRLIKPWRPAAITTATPPAGLTGVPGNQSVTLTWATNTADRFYSVYRGAASGGPYTKITLSVLTNAAFTDVSVTNGVPYFYVVTGLNILGEESGYSSEAAAWPVSTSPTSLGFSLVGNVLRFNWPANHTGWELQVQTNPPNTGLGTNWLSVPNSNSTNLFSIPIDRNEGSAFFRLKYP